MDTNKKNPRVLLILDLLRFVGWSETRFAEKYLTESSERDLDEDEYARNTSCIRKRLQRASCSVKNDAFFIKYIKFIEHSEDFTQASKILSFEEFLVNQHGQHAAIVEAESHDHPRQVLSESAAFHQLVANSDALPASIEALFHVAYQHAMTMGNGNHFLITDVSQDEDVGRHYLVIWSGRVDYSQSVAGWHPLMCMVEEMHESYHVQVTGRRFDVGLAMIDDVIFRNGKLYLRGRRARSPGRADELVHVYEVILELEREFDELRWTRVNEIFLGVDISHRAAISEVDANVSAGRESCNP